MRFSHQFKLVLPGIAFLILTACAPMQKPLYHWGAYEQNVSGHFNGTSPEVLIPLLEKQKQEAQASGTKLPPGFYAHLGMLYQTAGRNNEFLAMMALEKSTYPESQIYLNNLLKNKKN